MMDTIQEGKNRKYIIILLLIVLFHAIINYMILRLDNTPLTWDGGEYFFKSLRYFNVFKDIGPGFISKFNDVSRYRPPLFMLSSLPLYAVFGRSTDVAAMTNVLCLAVLVFSVCGIGARMHSRGAGIMAAMVVSMFPIMFGMSRSYWLDFPLAAMVSLSMYLLVRTENFRDRRFTVLFGISCGLGMLTKWTHFVFIAGPVLYVFFESFRNDAKQAPVFVNGVICLIVAIAVSSFWYFPNARLVVSSLFDLSVGVTGDEATRSQQLGESFGPTGIFNIASFTYYAGKYVNDQAGFLFAALSLVFTVLLFRRLRGRDFWMLVLWVAVPVFAFTLIKNKTPRNTVPILPAASLLISIGIMSLKSRSVRKSVTAGMIFIAIMQYASSSIGIPFLPKKAAVKTPIGDIVFFEQYANNSHALFRANRGEWKAEEILKAIDMDRGDKQGVEIVLLPRDAFNWMSMEYTSLLSELPFTFIGAVNTPEAVLSCDYVLLKKGGFVAPGFLMPNIHLALDLMEDNKGKFLLLKSISLPEKRIALPLYDVTATRKGRKSGVVFAEKVQVLDYLVSESSGGGTRRFTVEATLKGMADIKVNTALFFIVMNNKMEPMFRKIAIPEPSIHGLRSGETRKVTALFEIPPKAAERFFGFEMGFMDLSSGREMEYSPEYLVYRRSGG